MPKRIAIDTNLWLSHVLNGFKSNLTSILEDENVDIITSPELTAELFGVLARPKFAGKISPEAIESFRQLFEQAVIEVAIHSEITECRDPKDNHLLALCLDAELDFLLTGDGDLLVLHPFHDTQILKVAEYRAIFG